MNRNSRQAIVAVASIPIHMEIVERVAHRVTNGPLRDPTALARRSPEAIQLPGLPRFLMICARDVPGTKIVPKSVIDLEQFITNPRVIKRQLPLKPRILSASSNLDGPRVLR